MVGGSWLTKEVLVTHRLPEATSTPPARAWQCQVPPASSSAVAVLSELVWPQVSRAGPSSHLLAGTATRGLGRKRKARGWSWAGLNLVGWGGSCLG